MITSRYNIFALYLAFTLIDGPGCKQWRGTNTSRSALFILKYNAADFWQMFGTLQKTRISVQISTRLQRATSQNNYKSHNFQYITARSVCWRSR
jgi:hypothetical protein